jgi:hypothetical protein
LGAVEGGTGYWASVAAYRWEELPAAEVYAVLVAEDEEDDLRAFAELFTDANGRKPRLSELLADAGGIYKLDIEAVAKGLGKIKRGEVGVRADLLDAIKTADRENDAGYIDAEGADVIAQAGLLGGVVYG